MPKKPDPETDAPKKVTPTPSSSTTRRWTSWRALRGARLEPCEVPYTRFAFKGPDCNVAAYTSGKVVIAGKGTEEFVTMTLEPEVTGAQARLRRGAASRLVRAARGPRRERQGRFLRPGDRRHGDRRQAGHRVVDQGRRADSKKIVDRRS
jgi:hypothetical protein